MKILLQTTKTILRGNILSGPGWLRSDPGPDRKHHYHLHLHHSSVHACMGQALLFNLTTLI